MKTLVNLLLITALVLVVVKLWPLALAVGSLAGLVLVASGGLLAGGLSAVLGLALALLVALLGVILVTAVALSPIWIPVLALIGLISLLRRPTARTTKILPIERT